MYTGVQIKSPLADFLPAIFNNTLLCNIIDLYMYILYNYIPCVAEEDGWAERSRARGCGDGRGLLASLCIHIDTCVISSTLFIL